MSIPQLIDDIFRQESGKLISTLTRIFGSENLELAEDVVQESMLEAMNHWSEKGVPENPVGWLFRVAKNKAINILNREKYKLQYSSDVAHFLYSEWTAEPALDLIFSDKEILDDQLRMMFTCCHPAISPDSQVALTLKTLCGLSIPEIAKAFVTSEENIKKRLVRARQKIREAKVAFQIPDDEGFEERLQTVLQTIYLVFNEGYSASQGSELIRYELCEEAMRLTELILSHERLQNKSDVYALLALMYLNASRFKSRTDKAGNIFTMAQQDRSLWDLNLLKKGLYFLEKAASSNSVSSYHIMASISAYHCAAADYQSTDWISILTLYDKLVQIDRSPIVLLNRAIALANVNGTSSALDELRRIEDDPAFESYHLFYSTRAEFYLQENNLQKARENINKAIDLSSLDVEKDLLRRKLSLLKKS